MFRDNRRGLSFVFMLIFLLCFSFFSLREALPAEPTLDIEKLTQGKVKVGDLITKDNVDLVKDFLTDGVYYLVKEGMCLEIGPSPAPYQYVPKWYQAIEEKTHKEYGEPVMDENACCFTKDGKPWLGATPFLHPSNMLEILANEKYYRGGWDQYTIGPLGMTRFDFHDGEKIYKFTESYYMQSFAQPRYLLTPTGSTPGLEKEFYRSLTGLLYPLNVKGIGQLAIRYWDDVKKPDEGFAYLAAFKRIVRISATTWQDNKAGSDMKWGDAGGGYVEPYVYYKFRLIEKKPMLAPRWDSPAPIFHPADITYDYGIKFDGPGGRFPREKWVLREEFITESIPVIRHCYGKRIQIIMTPEYSCGTPDLVDYVDFYDRQGKLWKVEFESRFLTTYNGEPMTTWKTQYYYDVQTGHSTHATTPSCPLADPNKPLDARDLTLKLLIAKGK